jgi:hypothetical protein
MHHVEDFAIPGSEVILISMILTPSDALQTTPKKDVTAEYWK